MLYNVLKPQAHGHDGDVPRRIYRELGILMSVLFLAALLAFGSLQADFLLAEAIVLAVMYFGVPYALLRLEARYTGAPPVREADFDAEGIDVWTGHLTAREVSLQILLIPAALATAMVVIACIWLFTA